MTGEASPLRATHSSSCTKLGFPLSAAAVAFLLFFFLAEQSQSVGWSCNTLFFLVSDLSCPLSLLCLIYSYYSLIAWLLSLSLSFISVAQAHRSPQPMDRYRIDTYRNFPPPPLLSSFISRSLHRCVSLSLYRCAFPRT